MTATVGIRYGGMICPVGLRSGPACAALRAGISRLEETPYADRHGTPIVGGRVCLPGGLTRASQRLQAMLAFAVGECLESGPFASRAREIPIIVGLAEPSRPGGAGELVIATLLAEVRNLAGVTLHPTLSRTMPTGHTSVFRGLAIARDLLERGAAPACLVAGVDSYLNAESLLWLDEHKRLKTSYCADGLIPGEAAACVLVEPRLTGRAASVGLLGLGFGIEEATVCTEEPPLMGRGMGQAMGAALAEAGLGLHEIDVRLTDVGGEAYGFKELTLGLQRTMRVRRKNIPILHPSESIGDTGAASGACQLLMVLKAFQRGYAPGLYAIGHTSALMGDRAAIVLGRDEVGARR